MSKTLKTVFFLVLAATLAAPVAALQVDTATRADNSLGEQPPAGVEDDVALKMNLQDCREMDAIEVEFTLSTDVNDNTANDLYFFIGNKCNEDVLGDNCDQILDIDGYDGTVTSVRVSLWELFEDIPDVIFGIDGSAADLEALCTGATTPTGTHQLWAALLSDNTDETSGTWAASVPIEIDVEPPDSPTDVSVEIGQNKATVSWSNDDIDDYDGAYVLYQVATNSGGDAGAAADGGDGACSGPIVEGEEWDRNDGNIIPKKITQKDVTTTTITGLINGATYQFAVVSYDAFLNTSVQSEVVCAEPWSTCGFYCDYSASGGSGGGSFCFVATAAFGSYDHPVVKLLRGFRDEFLAVIPGGEALIQAYYAAGPAMARVVEGNSVLRAAARAGLTLFAGFAWLFTIVGPSGSAVGLSVLFAFVVGRRFSRRRRR